jgi:hypothetical protein
MPYVYEKTDAELKAMETETLRNLDVMDADDEERLQKAIDEAYDDEDPNIRGQEQEIRLNVLREYGVDPTDQSMYSTFESPEIEEEANAKIEEALAEFRQQEQAQTDLGDRSWKDIHADLKSRYEAISEYLEDDEDEEIGNMIRYFKSVLNAPKAKEETRNEKYNVLRTKIEEAEARTQSFIDKVVEA